MTNHVNLGITTDLHVYEWLDLPPKDKEEEKAKEWLDKFTTNPLEKHEKGYEKWLNRHKLTVVWRGMRYRCTGASRMGDVWIAKRGSRNHYDHRVSVNELSDWKRVMLR